MDVTFVLKIRPTSTTTTATPVRHAASINKTKLYN
jgi:hypothetical protein